MFAYDEASSQLFMIKIWGNALTFGFKQLCKAQEEKNVASFLSDFDITWV